MKIIIAGHRQALPGPVLLLAILLCSSVDIAFSRSPRSTSRAKNETTEIDCELVKPFFESKHIAITSSKREWPVDLTKTMCGGPCCSRETEEKLRHEARADFHNLIHHHSKSLQGLLATTAEAVRETVTVLVRQSENKTLTLFDQVYRTMAVQSRPTIRALYKIMVDYISPKNTADTLDPYLTRADLQDKFIVFFTKLFPIAYHRTVNPLQQDFTDNFKACLYETMEEIQPFGDIPKQISNSVTRSLEATRLLIQALTLGKTVLDKTDSVLFSGASPQQDACYGALLRMTYCPRCKGLPTRVGPCSGFCTNVMRGCLTEPASELDLAWSGYVETVEWLVVAVDGRNDPQGLNAEKAVRQLDTRISDAIMHAMENGPALEEKVRKICGRSELQPSTSEIPTAAGLAAGAVGAGGTGGNGGGATGAVAAGTTRSNGGVATLEMRAAAPPPASNAHRTVPTQLHVQLGNFLASVVRSRTFYGTLADAICEEYPDKHCWNGERVGEYAKTVVDSSLTAQRYNPEFAVTTLPSTTTSYGNANTRVLIDQLRHISQIVQSQVASAPDSGTLLADEALEGSGSGDRDDDEDGTGDDRDDEEASGSGMGPTTPDSSVKREGEKKLTSSAATFLASSILLCLACLSSLA